MTGDDRTANLTANLTSDLTANLTGDLPAGPEWRVLTLEVAVGTDPIEGRLLGGGGPREFTGWLGFVRAMEEATAGERPQ